MAKEARSLHHMMHEETDGAFAPLSGMEVGQVFVREGAPHMLLRLDTSTMAAVAKHHSIGNGLYVVNLLTGSSWTLPGVEQVYPATDVKLTFKTNRRPPA